MNEMTERKANGAHRYTPIASNRNLDVIPVRTDRYGGAPKWPVLPGVHERVHLDCTAKFAMLCIERWGMVAAVPDGEDSAGRAKLRPASVDEVVSRACDSAEKFFAEAKKRGWMVDVPSIEELLDASKDQENAND
jgi:hypothetical protein